MNYVYVIEKSEDGYGGFFHDMAAIATAKTKEALKLGMARALASWLRVAREDGLEIPRPTSVEDFPLAEYDLSPDDIEGFDSVEPTQINPLTLELSNALSKSGLSIKEVASKMNTSRQAIYRFIDPFYFGLSFDNAQKLAKVLGYEIKVSLEAA